MLFNHVLWLISCSILMVNGVTPPDPYNTEDAYNTRFTTLNYQQPYINKEDIIDFFTGAMYPDYMRTVRIVPDPLALPPF